MVLLFIWADWGRVQIGNHGCLDSSYSESPQSSQQRHSLMAVAGCCGCFDSTYSKMCIYTSVFGFCNTPSLFPSSCARGCSCCTASISDACGSLRWSGSSFSAASARSVRSVCNGRVRARASCVACLVVVQACWAVPLTAVATETMPVAAPSYHTAASEGVVFHDSPRPLQPPRSAAQNPL